MKVARARLGFSAGKDPDQVARIRADVFKPLDVAANGLAALEQAGLLTRRSWRNQDGCGLPNNHLPWAQSLCPKMLRF